MSDTRPATPAHAKPTAPWLAAQRAKQEAYAAGRRRQAQAWIGETRAEGGAAADGRSDSCAAAPLFTPC